MYLSLWEKQNWPAITDPNLPEIIVRQTVMRTISTMRKAHKGGTIIIVPHKRSHELTSKKPADQHQISIQSKMRRSIVL